MSEIGNMNPPELFPSFVDTEAAGFDIADVSSWGDDMVAPEENEALAQAILDGTEPVGMYLGSDSENTRAVIGKYGAKGMMAIWHPEEFPLD